MRFLARLFRIWRDRQSHLALMLATYGPRHYESDKARDAEADARIDVISEVDCVI